MTLAIELMKKWYVWGNQGYMRKRTFLYSWIGVDSSVPKKKVHSCLASSMSSVQQVSRGKISYNACYVHEANISLSSVFLVARLDSSILNRKMLINPV